MGYGGYSFEAHQAIVKARADAPRERVFAQTKCHPLMNPHGVKARESRDSGSHPDSLAVAFALDVTGSMGEIPELLAKRELPGFMRLLLDHGVRDPQVLFMAVGDAFADEAPLQVGQFESTAELMDRWLTWSWLAGGGGGGDHESYDLALWFAARHFALDCWESRRRRGFLFLTGDEKPYPRLSKSAVRSVIGDELEDDVPLAEVVREASRALDAFFLIPDPGRRHRCEEAWREVLGDQVICMESPADTCGIAAGIVALREGALPDVGALAARLGERGWSRERIGGVVRALLPWAATLGRDGAPAPALDRSAPLAP